MDWIMRSVLTNATLSDSLSQGEAFSPRALDQILHILTSLWVRPKGLEPPHLSILVPKTSTSTNSVTGAFVLILIQGLL